MNTVVEGCGGWPPSGRPGDVDSLGAREEDAEAGR